MHHAAPHKNPYAAVWADAEKRLTDQINQIHELGLDIDKSRHGLHWQGASARRFDGHVQTYHRDLARDNDTLRWLLKLVRMAAELKVPQPQPSEGGAAA